VSSFSRPLLTAGFLLLIVAVHASFASGACGVRTILVQGRAEDVLRDGSVTVELIYEQGEVGESDRILFEGSSFRTRIPFSTQNSSHEILCRPLGKCNRMPTSVAVVLLEGDQEVDRVTLSVAKDFNSADATELAVRSAVVLHGTKIGSPKK
jgi:hypothetical protein